MSIQDEIRRIRESIEQERGNPVRIALFGQPGAGKSSLINAIVGQPVAKVSPITDTTIDASRHVWHDLELWDLPGYGTSRFPAGSFIERFEVDKFDMYLCVFEGKFRAEDDRLVFEQVRAGNRPCVLVRNKSDALKQKGMSREELFEAVRQDAKNHSSRDAEVYFTSCDTDEGIAELQEAIHRHLEPAKKARFVRSAKHRTEEALEAKSDAARDLVTKYAGLAAANGLNPIPGADVAVDLGILYQCFGSIREAYGLTDAVLKDPNTLVAAGPVVNRLLGFMAKEGIMQLLKKYAGRQAAKAVAKYIPLVGQILAASAGFAIVKLAGDSFVDDCHEAALKLMRRELRLEGAAE